MYSATQDALYDTGIEPLEMKKLLKEIHLHSVEYLHNIVVQRRQLDTQALRHQTHLDRLDFTQQQQSSSFPVEGVGGTGWITRSAP